MEHADRVRQLGELSGLVTAEGAIGHAQDRERHRRLRGHPAARAGDQRPGRRQGPGRRWAVTGRDHTHLALQKPRDEKIRFRDVQAQPRKIISSPTWSGIESETVSYNAGYIQRPRTDPLAHAHGRQQFYPWTTVDDRLRRRLSSYRPPVDLKTTGLMAGI